MRLIPVYTRAMLAAGASLLAPVRASFPRLLREACVWLCVIASAAGWSVLSGGCSNRTASGAGPDASGWTRVGSLILDVHADPLEGAAPLSVAMEASVWPNGADGVEFDWEFGDGASEVGPSATHTFTVPGTYIVTVTARHRDGRSGSARATIRVHPANEPPVAAFTASPDSGAAPLEVSFDGTSSRDPDGEVVAHMWDFGDGSPEASGPSVTHTYETPGTYTVILAVMDDRGATDVRREEDLIAVDANQPPRAALEASATSGRAPLQVSFDGSLSEDPDGAIARFLWDFGDGSPGAEGETVVHFFEGAGTFLTVLTVVDDRGAEDQAEITITAWDALTCPTCEYAGATGTVESGQVNEASGLAASRTQPGVLWVHNDSGDSARFFAMGEDGRHLGTFSLADAPATDWEDMAVGPCPEGGDCLFFADIGDNPRIRPFVRIIRVPEPLVEAGDDDLNPEAKTLGDFAVLEVVYPDGPHDAETLVVDPVQGDIYIVTKEGDGHSRIFRYEAPHDPSSRIVLTEVGGLRFGSGYLPGDRSATAGDVSPDGSMVIIRTYSSAFVFLREPETDLALAFSTVPCSVPLVSEPQGEAIAFVADGSAYLTVSEGRYPEIHRFDCGPPRP